MVFQSFALFPWLTVEQNVELGLEAKRVPAAEGRARRAEAIDLIGLGGFEIAYPQGAVRRHAPTGGLRPRPGGPTPTLLLMDEPFSALDVLTAETMRTDIIDLWSKGGCRSARS